MVIRLHIVIFVLDEIQKGGLVYCPLMKEILNVYSGKEADCITVFLQAVNICSLLIKPHNGCRRKATCIKTFVHAELSIYANSFSLGLFLPLEKSTKFTSPV